MKIKLKESNEVTTDLEKIIRDATSNGKFPDTISYKGKTYKEFQVMDFDRPEVSQVYYCNMENTPSGDPQESNDYFFVSATLNKVPNGYKGVKEINFVEDLTESEDEVPKITAFSIAQFEAERLGGRPLNIDENHSAVEFKFRGKVYNIDIRLKELGDSVQETDGTQVDDIAKKEDYPQFKLGKKITNLVEDEVINNLEPEEKQDLANIYNERIIKGYKCVGCNKEIKSITDFTKSHKGHNTYSCPYCGEPYSFEGLASIEIKESGGSYENYKN